MPRDGFAAESAGQPCAGRGRIEARLGGGEGLGGDDEQGRRRIETGDDAIELAAVDVGEEMHAERRLACVAQRIAGELRPEVRAADADVDHVGDAASRVAGAPPAADVVGQCLHACEHGRDVGAMRIAAGSAQRHVQDRALLGVIDRLARDHRRPRRRDAGDLGDRQQAIERGDVNELFTEIQAQPGGFYDEAREP